MSESSQLKSGVILNYINLAIGCIIPLVYTPLMLKMLGQSEYGLYSLANSVVGYLSLLSFGLGSTIIRYISKYRAEGDKEKEEKVIGLFIIIYVLIGIIIIILGYILSINVNTIFEKGLTIEEIQKIKILINIMAFNLAISFPISVLTSIIVAHEKFIYRQLLNMLSSIISPCANIVALYLGYGSVGMCLAATLIQFIILPLSGLYCFKVLDILPKFNNLPFCLLKEIFGFSAFVFLGSLVDMMFWATDKIILGMLASTTQVAIYNVGAQFNTMMTNLSTAFSGVLTPKVTIMVTKKNDNKELTSLFIKVGRIQYYIIALALSGFIVFGKQFIDIWVGNGYLDAYYIALITLIPLMIPLIQNTGLSILLAENKHRFRSIVYFIIAVFNVVFTYILVPKFGAIGAAFCSGLSYIIGQGLIMNLYYLYVIKIDIRLFWKNILHISILPLSLCLFFFLICKFIIIDSWFLFFIFVFLYSFIYSALAFLFFMNEYEKDIIKKPLKKIKNFIFSK